MWTNGVLTFGGKEYRWEAKVYDQPSIFGIDNGRVSKLFITGSLGGCIYNYDRGLDSDRAPKGLVAAVITAACAAADRTR